MPSVKMQACVGHLMVVHYVKGTTMTREMLISYVPPTEVQADRKAGVWYYKRGTPHQASFTIGTGVRVPEGKEFYGPMMVFDPGNSEHCRAVEMNKQLLEAGTLTP